ncbi:MAG: 30S ribosomal protein S20 [Syntrophales bacterium]|nr:30S ribosomal protein S20 [Syntrophales bacterium]
MAKHKSAIKRARQNERRRQRNAAVKSSIKTAMKKVLNAVSLSNKEEARRLLQEAIPKISRAGTKGYIHKRNAARKISKLTKKVNALFQT